jgi:hypothetical protein
VTEFSAYWAEHPSLFVAPAGEPDPERRALLVLKWFLSTLKEQHNPKDENGKKKRLKPLNPFLGELFIGKWEDEAGTTNLVSEQISHHPPATAFNVWNDKHGVRVSSLVSKSREKSNQYSCKDISPLKRISLAQCTSTGKATLSFISTSTTKIT